MDRSVIQPVDSPFDVDIASLVPLEPSVVRSSVSKYERQMMKGNDILPIDVVSVLVGGQRFWVVSNGHHRVRAAINTGRDSIAALEKHVDSASLNYYSQVLVPWRLHTQQVGFKLIQIDSRSRERRTRIKRDTKAMEGYCFLGQLQSD